MTSRRQARSARTEGVRRNVKVYMKSRMGLIGLGIIVFFLIIATLAPWITANDPLSGFNVSSPYSVPAWATVLPRYANLPLTLNPLRTNSFSGPGDLAAWSFGGNSSGEVLRVRQVSDVRPPGQTTGGSLFVNASFSPSGTSQNPLIPGQPIFTMSQPFDYTAGPPSAFVAGAFLKPVSMTNVSVIYANFIISSPSHNFSLGSVSSYTLRTAISFPRERIGGWGNISIPDGLLPTSGNPDFAKGNPGATIFSSKGTYRFSMQILAVPSGKNPGVSLYLSGVTFQIPGRAFGLLGTDVYGRDVWSQFVWGSRISFLVGILSALGAVCLGTLTGLASGLWGGRGDEFVMRTTDFFLVIPFLPLAIAVVLIVGQSPALFAGIYYWIILLFVVLSWPSVARIVRSQVLSIKERQFVEASRALGGGQWHITLRHILPNVMGLVYSQTALLVPGFILTEAGLDFLAIAVHPINTITWGVMLTQATADALTNSVADYAWWWFLPPGIAIALLSLAFVLVGFALDGIFNPKLRHR